MWDENTYSTGDFVPQVPHWWGTGSVPISLYQRTDGLGWVTNTIVLAAGVAM